MIIDDKVHSKVLPHPIFDGIYQDLLRFVKNRELSNMLLVIGPSGIGKTTLQSYILYQLSIFTSERESYGPPIYLELDGDFTWRSFYEDLLEKLGDTGLQKADFEQDLLDIIDGKPTKSNRNVTVAKLRKAAMKRISQVNPIAILLDECHHFCEDLSKKIVRKNLNNLKTFVNKSTARLLLFGTHDAHPLLNANEQLSRRVQNLYFRPYQNDNEDDITAFVSAFKTLCLDKNLEVSPKIKDDIKFIYDHSLGCVGVLAEWISRCADKLSSIDSNILDHEIMRSEKIDSYSLGQLLINIKKFQEYYKNSRTDFDPELFQTEMTFTDQTSSAKGNKKPGTRNPTRDGVKNVSIS